jgi:hypothetical protein
MKGQCLCGAVRYECADPTSILLCHCPDCQKASGSSHMPVAFVPTASFKSSGETRVFAVRGEAGSTVRRAFCTTCGSQIFGFVDELADLVIIKMGTAIDPPHVPVAAAIWTDTAPPYARWPEGVATFPRNPPMAG